jgi:hypothetical protein
VAGTTFEILGQGCRYLLTRSNGATVIMTQIIRAVEDGVEFFTVEATGESRMSYSGLANLSGVNQSSISPIY